MLLEIAEQLRQKPGFRANTLATRMHIHERQVYAVAGAELVDVARRILGRDPDAAAMQAARAAATRPPAPATATAPAPTSGGGGGGGGSDRYQPPAGLSPAQSALLVALATQKFQDQPEANFVAMMSQYERVVANRDDAAIATLATSFRVTLSAPTASTSPSPAAAPIQAAAPATATQTAATTATPPPPPAAAAPATAPAPTSGGGGGGGGSDRYQPPAGLSPAQSALLVALATQKFQDQPEANFVALMTQYERVVANRDDATIATLATSFRVTLSAPTASTSPSPTAAPTPATTATPSGRPTMVCPNQACVSSREDSSEEDSDEDDDHGVVPVYCGMCGTKLVEG